MFRNHWRKSNLKGLKGPGIRTCFVCKSQDRRENLLRFTGCPGKPLCYDQSETNTGRGMWVHQDCLETAFQKRLFYKAAKGTVRISDALSKQMKNLFNITVEADQKTERRPL